MLPNERKCLLPAVLKIEVYIDFFDEYAFFNFYQRLSVQMRMFLRTVVGLTRNPCSRVMDAGSGPA